MSAVFSQRRSLTQPCHICRSVLHVVFKSPRCHPAVPFVSPRSAVESKALRLKVAARLHRPSHLPLQDLETAAVLNNIHRLVLSNQPIDDIQVSFIHAEDCRCADAIQDMASKEESSSRGAGLSCDLDEEATNSAGTFQKHDLSVESMEEEQEVAFESPSPVVEAAPAKRTKEWWRDYAAMAILGTINNLAYVVVNSSAQALANSYPQPWVSNMLGAIPFCNIVAAFAVKFLNAFYLENIPHRWRLTVNTVFMLIGLYFLAVSTQLNFAVALACIIVVGATSGFGESVILGMLKHYDSELVGGWSAGTGVAGVAGSGMYLICDIIGLELIYTYLLLVPTAFLYFFAYEFMLTSPEEAAARKQLETARDHGHSTERESVGALETDSAALLQHSEAEDGHHHQERDVLSSHTPSSASFDGVDPSIQIEPTIDQDQGWKQTWRCLKVSFWLSLNLFLVYFFEYVASTGAADKSNPIDSPSWPVAHGYAILSFCYQIGVLISRSSLQWVHIRRVEVLSVLQLVNFLLWMFQASFHFINIWVQFALMIYVGLLGGASYVNIFYRFLHDDDFLERDRELCINLATIWVTAGITLASLFTILMDNTWLKDVVTF